MFTELETEHGEVRADLTARSYEHLLRAETASTAGGGTYRAVKKRQKKHGQSKKAAASEARKTEQVRKRGEVEVEWRPIQ